MNLFSPNLTIFAEEFAFIVLTLLGIIFATYIMNELKETEARESQLRARLKFLERNVNDVTQNMRDGLYLIHLKGSELKVEMPYSSAFPLEDDEKEQPFHALLEASDLSGKEIHETLTAIKASFNSRPGDWDSLAKAFPKEVRMVRNSDGRSLALSWSAVRREDERVAGILLQTQDISELSMLREDIKARGEESQRLMELLGNTPQKMAEFLNRSDTLLADLKAINIEQLSAQLLSERIKSLAAQAKELALEDASKGYLELDKQLPSIISNQKMLKTQAVYIHCEGTIRTYKRLFFRTYAKKYANKQITADTKTLLSTVDAIEVNLLRSHMEETLLSLNEMRRMLSHSLDKILAEEVLGLEDLAHQRNIPLPQVSFNELHMVLDEPVTKAVRRVLSQVIHNSFDHGIEDQETRLALGKEHRGQIHIQSQRIGDTYHIRYQDDGKGLDLEKISYLAQNLGIALPSGPGSKDEALAQLIFEAGITTQSHQLNDGSPRIGLDFAARILSHVGGKIYVKLDSETGRYRKFSTVIEVPAADSKRENEGSPIKLFG